MEEMDYNILFHWFVGLDLDDPVWDAAVFTKNRDRLLEAEGAKEFLARVVGQARTKGMDFGRALHRRKKRKRIEECFRWLRTIALPRKARHRGTLNVDWMSIFACAAYNLAPPMGSRF